MSAPSRRPCLPNSVARSARSITAPSTTKACNEQPCPEVCEGDLGERSDCSATCGTLGEQDRTDTIISEAAHGGAQCGDDNSVLTNESTSTRECKPTPSPYPDGSEGDGDSWTD